ncbi:MAG: helix-turn-helix domain-containing protein [Christensenellales bacterium]|jgi:AraC-like DNA-binding protein
MPIHLNLSAPHQVVAANSHYYKQPTEPLYLNRTLQFHNFIYLRDGQWMVTESDTDYFLEKDDVLLLSAGHRHYTRLPCVPHTRTMCVHISCEQGDLTLSPTAITLPTHLNIGGHAKVRNYFENIVSTFWSDQKYKQERLAAYFNLLVLELLDVYQNASRPEPDIANEIVQLINGTPHKRFTAKEIAARFSVSIKTMNAIMLRSTGKSFAKYQSDRKLEMAASQMKVDPAVKLSEIASMFGFYDEFHLSRSFKQKYGFSPTQYKSFTHNDGE